MVNVKSCHSEGGLFTLWLYLEGKQPLLRFDKLIFTTYDGNNCFIIPKKYIEKECLAQFIAGGDLCFIFKFTGKLNNSRLRNTRL